MSTFFRRFRGWIFLGLMALLFLEIWLGFPIKLENPDSQITVENKTPGTEEVQQKMKGVHLVESSKGTRDWELYADAAEGFEGKGKWQIQKVKIMFYSENKVQFTVTGKSGELDTKTKDMKIEGDVRTVSENGYRFESPSIQYQAGPRVLESPGPVRMTGPSDSQGEGMVVTSNFMRGEIDKSLVHLEGNVVARRRFKNGNVFGVRAGRAEFSGLHYQAHFRNQVTIEYGALAPGRGVGPMRLESPEASFQYKSTSNLLEFVQLKGGVKINDAEKYATADQVRIEPETNRIVLNGKPRVVQGQDELMGEQIVFIDGGKKVKIEKMRARVEKDPSER
ncbi:MAG: LPS export ABC transporter periplasmic protein LptC [Bdellovibrionaceae bacterium]|nr:LPS export ABC transporter periplasmic protein LptC [Pseudobdellovibrionaceae bacterium]